MIKISQILFLCCCFCSINVIAQICDPPSPPSNTCGNAPVVCDLDGWCGNSGGYSPTSQPNAFCGIVENNCWVSFRAYTTFLEIEVSTANCPLGNGVQAQMFYTEDCGFFTSVSNCLNPVPANDSRILIANNLIPGTIYHIMVDGKEGDFCDFSFEVLAGLTTPLADLQEQYTICEQDTFLLGQEITFIDAYTYFWETEGGNFASSPNGPITQVDTAGLYTITVIDEPHGCVDTATVEVIISPPPIIDVLPPDTLDCGENKTIVLDASNSEFGANSTIEWLRFDGDTIPSTIYHDSIYVPGWYYLTLTNDLGCSNTDSVEVVSLIEFPIANAGLSSELNCLNEIVYIDGSNSSSGEQFEYQWLSPNGNIIPTNDNLIIGADEPGIYNLIVTNKENDCWTSDPVIVALNEEEPTGANTEINMPCFGETDGSINITNVIGGIPPYQYSLDTFSMLEIPFYQNLAPGDYPLMITDETGCTWDTVLTIPQPEPIIFDLGEDLIVELGDEVVLNTHLNRPMEQIVWIPNPDSTCLNCPSHIFTPLETETYLVQAIDDNSCVEIDEIVIQVLEKEKVYIPNAFSPNDDGINDVFMIYTGPDVLIINSLMIFDRWGNQLFLQRNFLPNDPLLGWNGFFRNKIVQPQVLAYVLEVTFINGDEEIYSGDLTVVY